MNCRICYEELEEPVVVGKDVLSPCACDGSVRYVHRACLEKWRKISLKADHCTICMQPLNYDGMEDVVIGMLDISDVELEGDSEEGDSEDDHSGCVFAFTVILVVILASLLASLLIIIFDMAISISIVIGVFLTSLIWGLSISCVAYAVPILHLLFLNSN